MSNNKDDKGKSGRREFIRRSLLAGGGAVFAGGITSGSSLKIDQGEREKALTADGRVVEVNKSDVHEVKEDSRSILRQAREGIPNRKFVMVVDLSKCKHAEKCKEACRKMHHLPDEVNWLKVFKMQDSGTTAPYWLPRPCFHCDNPPCVKVCPVDATFKRKDGIVLVDNERCIGCRFCMAACPYSARSFNWSRPPVSLDTKDVQYSPEKSYPRRIGTVEKCDFCPDQLRKGELPPCVKACPNGVYYMGDIYEDTVTNGSETLRFSQLIKDKAGYRLYEDLGTEPSVYYLPPANRLFPFKDDTDNQNES